MLFMAVLLNMELKCFLPFENTLEEEVPTPQKGSAILCISADAKVVWDAMVLPWLFCTPCHRFRPTSCIHMHLLPTHLDVSHPLQVLGSKERKTQNHHCCQSLPLQVFKRLTEIIPFSLFPQTGWTDGILLNADRTAGKAERCRVTSVKLGTYILRGAVTFNDAKDNANSDGNYLCSYTFRWGIYWQEARKGRKFERTR